jgi:hypothetical protein
MRPDDLKNPQPIHIVNDAKIQRFTVRKCVQRESLLKQNNILKMEDIIKHQGIIEKTFI